MISIQNFIPDGNTKDSNFKVVNKKTDGDVAMVELTTNYDTKPEAFKLVKEDGI